MSDSSDRISIGVGRALGPDDRLEIALNDFHSHEGGVMKNNGLAGAGYLRHVARAAGLSGRRGHVTYGAPCGTTRSPGWRYSASEHHHRAVRG